MDTSPSPANEALVERIASAPLPTARVLRQRQNVPAQLIRFVRINLRMLRVVAAKHY
ncbi:MAG: hypothetical protein FWD18_08685 [Micrococcales bacterium]|nr:hypothetical protein [Micrococcales bacterium]